MKLDFIPGSIEHLIALQQAVFHQSRQQSAYLGRILDLVEKIAEDHGLGQSMTDDERAEYVRERTGESLSRDSFGDLEQSYAILMQEPPSRPKPAE